MHTDYVYCKIKYRRTDREICILTKILSVLCTKKIYETTICKARKICVYKIIWSNYSNFTISLFVTRVTDK